jgi:hypothetical protein
MNRRRAAGLLTTMPLFAMVANDESTVIGWLDQRYIDWQLKIGASRPHKVFLSAIGFSRQTYWLYKHGKIPTRRRAQYVATVLNDRSFVDLCDRLARRRPTKKDKP